MFNSNSITAVDAATFLNRWQRPLYDSYSFGQIPTSIERLLDPISPAGLPADVFGPHGYPQVQRVVVVLIDALGWNLFQKAAAAQLIGIDRFVESGTVSKLSSLFPSTTVAHVHCLNSGLLPCQSGWFEWRQYWPTLDRVVSPLLFSWGEDAGGQGRSTPDTLVAAGITPEAVFQPSPFHRTLGDRGVEILEYLPAAYANSSYNRVVRGTAQRRGYDTWEAGLQDLAKVLNTPSSQQQYIKFYVPDIDTLSHRHGWDATPVWDQLKALFYALETTLFCNIPQQGETAILLTADHGQLVFNPGDTIYLDELIPDLVPMLAVAQDGTPLFPCGSNRDVFLRVQPDCVDAALALLQCKLAGIAQVLRLDQVAEVLFGPTCGPDFLAITGQILVLPEGNHTLFCAGPEGRYKSPSIATREGTHGGLTRAEAQVPLAYVRV